MTAMAELRDRLHELADATTAAPRPDLPEALIGEGRRRRRRRRRALSAVAAAAAVALAAAPAVLDRLPTSAAPAPGVGVAEPGEPTTSEGQSPAAVLPDADVYSGPSRGSLAGDAAFLAGMAELPWPEMPTGFEQPPDGPRTVVYATEAAGQRWALVAVDAGDDLVVVNWFAGPSGASPEQMEVVAFPETLPRSTPAALLDADTGTVLIVAAPGDRLEVSPRPDVDAAGTVGRTFEAVPTAAGTGVAAVGARRSGWDWSVRVQVQRGDDTATFLPVLVTRAPFVPTPTVVTLLRPAPGPSPADGILDGQPDEILSQVGLSAEDVTFTALWAGDVPATGGLTARVRLLAATLPSSAVYVTASAGVALDETSFSGFTCGAGVLPAGAPIAERTVALRCTSPDLVGDHLLVAGPLQGATVQLIAANSTVTAEHDLPGGAAAIPVTGAVSAVAVLDAAGAVVAGSGVVTPLSLEDR
ncbi:hypothetical protein ACWKWC_19325 [Geodermatophilus nigrescens]